MRFFHSIVKGIRKKLKLHKIQNNQGNWLEEEEEIAAEAVNFYHSQFLQERDATEFSLLGSIPEIISEADNTILCRQPTLEEIKRAVFNLNGVSTSGPDGLSGAFYQCCWDIVGTDIFRMVQEFFREVLSRGLNALFDDDQFMGYGLPKWSAKLNHLAYADDTIIFASTNSYSLKRIVSILQEYEVQSGQKVNKEKSAFYLHQSASSIEKQLVEECTGKSKHWAAWVDVCLPKKEGGLGFRSMFDISKAMYAKLWWRFRIQNTLWANFMWNKYCKKHIPTLVQWKDGSQLWKNMLQNRDDIEKFIWWEPKGGTSTICKRNYGTLILKGEIANKVWQYFSSAAGILGPWIQLKQSIKKWWDVQGNTRQKMVALFDVFRPRFVSKWVKSHPPPSGWLKCNTDGASRGNPRPCAAAFCIKNHEGDLVIAKGVRIPDSTDLVVEAIAIKEGLQCCLENNFPNIIIETDLLALVHMLKGEWEIPWNVTMEVNSINRLRNSIIYTSLDPHEIYEEKAEHKD
ncbi:hypothetical protein MTR67_023961 [Solanum verrucosum]|uniref:Uncharacterized protein n=1 Tax=Solanum verrucosum TaxID=315347 RepID=A0AAF0TSA0_SOLVR|nr:hypothetical protein MTR67_023961 [Solanum verrucosum]